MLTYSDILISAINIMPVLAALILGIQTLRDWADGIFKYSKFINIMIGLSLIIFGILAIIFIGGYSTTGALMAFFVALKKPFTDYLSGVLRGVEKNDIKNIYIVLFIFSAAFGQGAADYKTVMFKKDGIELVSVGEFNNCRLVRIYSEVILMTDRESSRIIAVKNSNDFSIGHNGTLDAIECDAG